MLKSYAEMVYNAVSLRSMLASRTSTLLHMGINGGGDGESKQLQIPNSVETLVACTSDEHEGRELINTTIPMNIDTLFSLIFTPSTFIHDFHTKRQSTDINHGDWIENESGIKERICTIKILLNQYGMKNCDVKEVSVMRKESQPGEIYMIDLRADNFGIPYADRFYVMKHFCLKR